MFYCLYSTAASPPHQSLISGASSVEANLQQTASTLVRKYMFYYLATFFNVLFYVLEFVFPDQLSRLRRLLPETAVGHFYSPFVPQVVVVMLLC